MQNAKLAYLHSHAAALDLEKSMRQTTRNNFKPSAWGAMLLKNTNDQSAGQCSWCLEWSTNV